MTQPPRPGPASRVSLPALSPSSKLYVGTEAGGSALLLVATLTALLWANSPWSGSYDAFWSTTATIGVGDLALSMDLEHWVNDAAMALFFLVVGLEITREVSTGELRDRRNVAAPALGALGGLLVPAAVYLAVNPSGPASAGWGIVMSTDTAFVLGILALFGPRCPDRLRLFLLTLAIVDDIGAISVMALVYSGNLGLTALAVSGVLVAVLVGLRWLGVWRLAPYVVTGIALWLAVHASGVHATLAGVLVGLLLPSKPTAPEVLDRTRDYGRALREAPDPQRAQLARLAVAATVPAGARLQQTLHRWTAYGVVPVFGLANAGVPLDLETLRTAATSPVTLGIAAALVVGNAIGITAGAAVALRTGWGTLPGGVRWSHLMAGATLAGIGFTISLFITDLAFTDERLREQATIGILAGSVVAAVAGVVLLRVLGERFSLCSPESEGPPALPPRPWLEPSVPA
ncbi:Na+/H+ antiporter NhaA [Blastococcus sp. CT_GayMR20]|uniref:Na+/H+ antiporter NhaA n=1 Tax=Blastococcus sp. CT_GayMR20 TaxID=2559609 RepID=UPI0010730F05|nr:Na+/H+ antiporter NhaA [Blastococcus sp. CT_GayMR20]TFV92481.1 Na+/H+ antiporter NhaA [Blastococcus sp. CT_GayMR20]TFV92490.1 Na+/H+ antiporter NhaA [Blastococcus sp. CT_GayMR20]